MKKLTVYLFGACKCLEDEGSQWREEITTKLEKVAEWCGCEIDIINPLKYFSYSSNKHKTNKQVKEYYLSRIKKCDLLIGCLDESDKSVGSGMEVQFATDYGIPCIGFGTKNIYPWIAEVDCQVVFDTMTEAVDYIRDYYFT